MAKSKKKKSNVKKSQTGSPKVQNSVNQNSKTETQKMNKPKKKKGLKIALIILGILAVLIIAALLIVPRLIVKSVYKENFGFRCTTTGVYCRDISEFEGLQRERHTFTSNEGQELVGYVYTKGNENEKGLVVLAHGFGGGGHVSYMDVADYFTSNGYKVFAYDVTGNDESGGDAVNGLPQGIIDLDYALDYVDTQEELTDLPLLLWGHSWGGYSVCTVAELHPEVKGVVSMAGFNSSLDMIEFVGRDMAGDSIDYIMPLFEELESKKFGEYAKMNVLESLEKSDAKVLMYHSADDDMIPIEMSFDKFYEKFADNDRFTFERFEDGGHNHIFNSVDSVRYRNMINKEFNEHIQSVGEANFTIEMRDEFIEEKIDKMKYFELDNEIMTQTLEFYDNCIE